ncbi:MAG: tetratricopeptide repeat protein, partial [Desulfovibrionaceae bacterium]
MKLEKQIALVAVIVAALGLVPGYSALFSGSSMTQAASQMTQVAGDGSVNVQGVEGDLVVNNGTPNEIALDLLRRAQKAESTSEGLSQQVEALTKAIEDLRALQSKPETTALAERAERELALGNSEKAVELFQQVADAARAKAASGKKEEAEAYRHMGAVAFLNDTWEALEAYQKATALDPENMGGWNQLGLLFHRTGEIQKAAEAYEKVLALGTVTQDKHALAAAYGNLGSIRKTQGDLAGSEECHLKSLAIDDELGRKEGMAADYCNLGNIRQAQGDLAGAEEYYRKALALAEELGSKELMAIQYGNLGVIRQTQGDLAGAEEYYRKALVLDEELGLKEGIATDYSNLGILRQMRGDLAGAEEYYHKSLAIEDELGRKEGMAADYCNLG